MATLLHKPKTPGLRFNTHKDALDFSAKSVEDSNNWLAVNNLDFVKRYKNTEIEIVLEFCFGAEGDKYHLVFCSVPNMGIGHLEETSTANLSPNANESGANRNDHFMLVSIAYLVECPQEVIPSLVRLEPAKERLDLLGYILGPHQRICHLSDTTSEGEGSVFGAAAARSNSYRVPGIVESTPKVVHQVPGNVPNGIWERRGQLDLVNLMVRLLRVRFNNSCVWIDLSKLCDLPLKLDEVFFSPSEFTTRTLEWV
jgi:hypothetical protein